jgi:hypothetical protein
MSIVLEAEQQAAGPVTSISWRAVQQAYRLSLHRAGIRDARMIASDFPQPLYWAQLFADLHHAERARTEAKASAERSCSV